MKSLWAGMRKAGRRSGMKSGRGQGQRRQRRPLWGAEQLEGRRMMAIYAYLDDGYRDGDDGLNFIADWAGINDSYHPDLIGLHIIGTEQNDTVDIFESNGVLNLKLTNADGSVEKVKVHSYDAPNIFFHGYGGDDTFRSNSAARTIAWGEGGNDVLVGGSNEVYLFGGDDDDTLSAGPLAYGAFFGEDGNDKLYGTELTNQMWGGEGFDLLVGGGGDDYLAGGAHDDVIYGGYGDDTILGGGGDDDLYGQWGDDSVDGAAGDDIVDGGRGVDFLYGGDNTDHMYGGPDEDYDYIAGQRGGDVFHINFSGLADGGVNPDDIADYRSNAGDRFDYSDVQNIVLEVVSRTSPNGRSSLGTMSSDEAPQWLYDDASWISVTWDWAALESLDGIQLITLPGINDFYSDAEPLTDAVLAEELPVIDWSETEADDASDPALENYDVIYEVFDDESSADESVFDEPIDEGMVDNYFGDLVSDSELNLNTILSTSGWFV